MIASFVITFRETLEAALIVGIILSYLVRIKKIKYNNVVYFGVFSGIFASLLGALLFISIKGDFTGRLEQIFEATMMLVGAFLLTTMIFWMMKQKHIAKELEKRVAEEISETHRFGLFFLVFISIFREGIETVIFLGASSILSSNNTLFGAILGILAAIFLGYLIFVGTKKINLKIFFNITSILLILFSAGLVSHAIHELQEVNVFPVLDEHIWDINPKVLIDGSYPLLHENGYIGGTLKGLFGYDGDPSFLEVVGYLIYIILVLALLRNINRIHRVI